MDVEAILSRLFNLRVSAGSSVQGGDGAAAADAHTGGDSIEGIGEEMTGGTGFLSYRRRLRIKRASDDLSSITVFVKLSDSSRDGLGHLQEFSNHFCPRECMFYGCLAPLLERTAAQFTIGRLPLPLVHHELVLPTGTVIVMEDLCEAGFQLAPSAMDAADARCVLHALGQMQAAFWLTKTRLGGAAQGLFGPDSPLSDSVASLSGSGVDLGQFLTDGYAVFRREYTKYLKCARRVAIIEAYLDAGFVDKARQAMRANREEKAAVGLNHSDLWYNNCMIRRDPDSGRPLESRLLDWQFFGIGSLAYDLGPFWLSSVSNAIVIEEFLPCVDFYHEAIRSVYEAKLQAEFPVSLDQMRQLAVQSLHWGIAWVVLSAETLWAFETVENLLLNIADAIEHFGL